MHIFTSQYNIMDFFNTLSSSAQLILLVIGLVVVFLLVFANTKKNNNKQRQRRRKKFGETIYLIVNKHKTLTQFTMKVYTKTGDKGTTALFGGTRVPKHHIRIDSYGTVDELNSYIGLIRDQEIDVRSKEILIHIQNKLFTVGAVLATDPEKMTLKNGKERLNRRAHYSVILSRSPHCL